MLAPQAAGDRRPDVHAARRDDDRGDQRRAPRDGLRVRRDAAGGLRQAGSRTRESCSRATYTRAGVPVEFRRTGASRSRRPCCAPRPTPAAASIVAATTDGRGRRSHDRSRWPASRGVHRRAPAYVRRRRAAVRAGVGRGRQRVLLGELFDRGTGARRAGVDATFVRTGGVEIAPAVAHDATGRLLIAATAAAPGEVVGDVVVRRADGFTTTVRGVHSRRTATTCCGSRGMWPSLLYCRGRRGGAAGRRCAHHVRAHRRSRRDARARRRDDRRAGDSRCGSPRMPPRGDRPPDVPAAAWPTSRSSSTTCACPPSTATSSACWAVWRIAPP